MRNLSGEKSVYERHVKRILDIICSVIFLVMFWWIYLVIAILVKVKLGSPVLFQQPRPGKNEKIFNMYKFRTMTNEKDAAGRLLPDELRITRFGKIMRDLSLDELPEVWLVLKGKMSFIGPRPLLVRDMIFMADNHRKRHSVSPGLSGLAQVTGRNEIDWQNKLDLDIQYIENISFLNDVKILFLTIYKVIKREGIHEQNQATATDYGDYLLNKGIIDKSYYDKKQEEAKQIIKKYEQNK